MDVPAELKSAITFLMRAKEIQVQEPIISYYCQLYACKLSIEQSPKTAEAKSFLLSLMDSLEKEKLALAGNEAISNETIGYAHVENFGLKIFIAADNEDRSGLATKKTARTFLASSIFLELLKTFDNIEIDAEKIKYAKYKAADIMKSLKEGRQPSPGIANNTMSESSNPDESNRYSDESQTTQQRPSLPSNPISVPQVEPSAPLIPDLAEIEDLVDEDIYNDEDRISIIQAGKNAKYAMSALLYDDVKTAIENLEEALAKLRPLKQYEI